MQPSPIRTDVRTSIHCAALGLLLCATARAAGGADDCANPDPITGFSAVPFTLVGATNSPEIPFEPPCSGSMTRDVWFAWTAPKTCWVRVNKSPLSTQLYTRVYDGANCPAPGTNLGCALAGFLVTAGSVYTVRVGVENLQPALMTGTITFEDLTPLEDSCATPKPFVGAGVGAQTNFALTGSEGQNQPNCQGPGGNAIVKDIWLVWTANFSGPALLESCGSPGTTCNSKAAIYLGSACPTALPIACDDDSCGAQQPRIAFTAVTGQDYLIQAGRSPADTSSFTTQAVYRIYSALPPPNDECSNAVVLNGPGPFMFDLPTATTSPGAVGCGPIATDLWYVWVAPASGTASFSTCASSPDTLIAVYEGASCPQGPQIGCADEGCGGFFGPSRVNFLAQCGEAYLLRLGSYGGAYPFWQGTFTVSITGTACSAFTPFCTGDSPAACPCTNTGWPGRGCASSFSWQGAVILGSGTASLANDTVSLRVLGVSPSFVTLLQGTSQAGGGAGISFGDGLLCAGGTLTRLVLRIANGGQLTYPEAGDSAVSVLGMVPAASTRVYQAWYRDASLAYCTVGTFNLTNGVEVSWTP